MRSVAAILVTTLLVPAIGHAQAEDADVVLGRLRERLLFARYRDAIVDAYELLERNDLSARQRNGALELLATAQIADRDEAGARTTLHTLFARDPGHRLEDADASPPVQSAFARARAQPIERVRVRLEHDASRVAADPLAPEVVVRVAEGAGAVEQLRLSFRPAGEARFVRLEMTVDEHGVARARLPTARSGSGGALVDYYIEALAPSLAVLASVGTEATPLQARIDSAGSGTTPTRPVVESPPAPEPLAPPPHRDRTDDDPGLFGQWWFWTGLVMVAGGVVTVVVVSGSEPAAPTGTLGSISF